MLYPQVNPCRYKYGSPVAYPLENPYWHGRYVFFGRLGTGMAPDTHGLPVLLPRYDVGNTLHVQIDINLL